MTRLLNFLFVVAGLCCVAAAEDEAMVTLSGDDIRALLTDNTAIYEDGARQFFAADGSTLYREPGRAVSEGTWRVKDNLYCSRWGISNRPLPETCYQMERQGKRITWDKEYPARIAEGNVFH